MSSSPTSRAAGAGAGPGPSSSSSSSSSSSPAQQQAQAQAQAQLAQGVAEELALARLDEAGGQLQREGRYLEALECLERGLVLRQRLYGARSDAVWGACKAAGELCNLLAMTYLQKQDYGMVGELLKKAEILTERDPAGRAVTFNNLACFCRQQGRLHASLTYLQRALAIEQGLQRVDNPADTHLNLCAVLSQLGRHEEALGHAQAALQLLQDELFGGPGGAAAAAQKPDRIAVLAIAYHNLGVEHEFLKQFTASLKAYTKGVEIAGVYLGAAHGITATLRTSQLGAARAIEDAKKREAAKLAERQQKIEAAAIAKAKSGMVKPGR